jgi:hypothetical protein
MGLQVLYGLWEALTHFKIAGISSWLALAGITIIAIVALGYGVYGLVRLAKWVSNMRIKEFSVVLLALGAIMVGAAIALP